MANCAQNSNNNKTWKKDQTVDKPKNSSEDGRGMQSRNGRNKRMQEASEGEEKRVEEEEDQRSLGGRDRSECLGSAPLFHLLGTGVSCKETGSKNWGRNAILVQPKGLAFCHSQGFEEEDKPMSMSRGGMVAENLLLYFLKAVVFEEAAI